MGRRSRKRSKRGFPVAILVAFHETKVVFWRVYSEKIRKASSISRGRKRKNQEEKQLYHFHDAIVDVLREYIRGGMRSILLVNPPKTGYTDEFMEHVHKHHRWLLKKGPQQAAFVTLEGNAEHEDQLLFLVQNEEFQEKLEEVSNAESAMILKNLEEILNKSGDFGAVAFSIPQIENLVEHKWKFHEHKPDYILLTDEFLDTHKQKNRIYRILQIANNKNIKTKIVFEESDAGLRIQQLGGIVCYALK